jgi:hypothetical protein
VLAVILSCSSVDFKAQVARGVRRHQAEVAGEPLQPDAPVTSSFEKFC